MHGDLQSTRHHPRSLEMCRKFDSTCAHMTPAADNRATRLRTKPPFSRWSPSSCTVRALLPVWTDTAVLPAAAVRRRYSCGSGCGSGCAGTQAPGNKLFRVRVWGTRGFTGWSFTTRTRSGVNMIHLAGCIARICPQTFLQDKMLN